MKKNRTFITLAMLALVLVLAAGLSVQLPQGAAHAQDPGREPAPQGVVAPQAPLGTSFTYQGQLLDSGSPADGEYDLRFDLYDEAAAGALLGTVTVPDHQVAAGLFTVQLDFGDVFTGTARFLEIGVRPGDSGGAFTTLAPRQELTPAPYALYAAAAPWSGLAGVPAGFADNVDDDTTYSPGFGLDLVGTTFHVVTSTIQQRVAGICGMGSAIRVINPDGTVVCETDDDSTGFWSLTGNAGTTPGTHFLGTTDGVSLVLALSGTAALRLEPNPTSPNLIGGHESNWVAGGILGATIGGGGESGLPNWVTADFGTVAGGVNNAACGLAATVGGGDYNRANGPYAVVPGGFLNQANGPYATVNGGLNNTAALSYTTVAGGRNNYAESSDATIGGGSYNLIRENSDSATLAGGRGNDIGDSSGFATIGGGSENTCNDGHATIGGGGENSCNSAYGTIPGGRDNEANGYYAFAAGRQAKANNQGCFVWGDSTGDDVSCDNDDRWVARASGGVYFYTNSGLTTGSYLAQDGNAWNSLSDRNVKENFAPVDTQELLARLAEHPITTWNYKNQDPAIRHVGPMAQDFNALLPGLGGEGETYINTLDADGVALAAIQGLYAQNQELATENAALLAENANQQGQIDALQRQNAGFEARLVALERGGVAHSSPLGLPSWLLLGGLVLVGSVVLQRRRGGGAA